ncbi:protein-glutamate O-methyltransferase CheR [uncultured Roseobacter sp.]|uniref:CheR family methyltransferase n=1 Tax=uncultured Roseobacter sp. TaxID=114847 RepID=UPI00262B0D9A|nr:protein-glutamate O-methyltransferase CheR [uncultured Roseobacter sp.]
MHKPSSETVIDTDSFNALAELTYRESGLQLAIEKTSMLQSRLRHRLSALGLQDFANYSAFVCSEEGKTERRHMISALTTNVSHFFREKHHFEILKRHIQSELLPKLRSGGRVRVWSAGCSNGQEALSIAMTFLELAVEVTELDLRILATDIDPSVIQFAKKASYQKRLVENIPEDLLQKYFTRSEREGDSFYVASEKILQLVRYRELNLLSDWPITQRIDVVFCRNVVIYFDVPTQNLLWPRFKEVLGPAGILFLGHSERISNPESFGFASDGPTTYRASVLGAGSSNSLKD